MKRCILEKSNTFSSQDVAYFELPLHSLLPVIENQEGTSNGGVRFDGPVLSSSAVGTHVSHAGGMLLTLAVIEDIATLMVRRPRHPYICEVPHKSYLLFVGPADLTPQHTH